MMIRFCTRLFPLLVLTCLLGCAPDNELDVNIRLTLEERERLDKMILARMDTLRPRLEAECDRSRKERIAVATDSIVQRALEQEARLRARIQRTRR